MPRSPPKRVLRVVARSDHDCHPAFREMANRMGILRSTASAPCCSASSSGLAAFFACQNCGHFDPRSGGQGTQVTAAGIEPLPYERCRIYRCRRLVCAANGLLRLRWSDLGQGPISKREVCDTFR